MAKSKPPAHSTAAEKELQRQEQETRRNLGEFVDSVLAVADESAHEIGVADAERELRRRRAEQFSSSVKELIAILADHPYAHQREYRLFKLWQVLGSVSFIANRWTERIEKRIKIESAAHATAKKKETTAKGDDVIVRAARTVWPKYPKLSASRVADQIYELVKDRLPRPLGQNAVAKRLKRLHRRIFFTD